MGRAAGQGHTGLQSLADAVETLETGQQRGMDVHQPIRERRNQPWGDDPHPAGHHHQIDRRLAETGHQGLIKAVAVRMLAVIVQFRGDSQPLSPLQGTALGVVHRQQHHIRRQVAAAAGLHQSLEVAALA